MSSESDDVFSDDFFSDASFLETDLTEDQLKTAEAIFSNFKIMKDLIASSNSDNPPKETTFENETLNSQKSTKEQKDEIIDISDIISSKSTNQKHDVKKREFKPERLDLPPPSMPSHLRYVDDYLSQLQISKLAISKDDISTDNQSSLNNSNEVNIIEGNKDHDNDMNSNQHIQPSKSSFDDNSSHNTLSESSNNTTDIESSRKKELESRLTTLLHQDFSYSNDNHSYVDFYTDSSSYNSSRDPNSGPQFFFSAEEVHARPATVWHAESAEIELIEESEDEGLTIEMENNQENINVDNEVNEDEDWCNFDDFDTQENHPIDTEKHTKDKKTTTISSQPKIKPNSITKPNVNILNPNSEIKSKPDSFVSPPSQSPASMEVFGSLDDFVAYTERYMRQVRSQPDPSLIGPVGVFSTSKDHGSGGFQCDMADDHLTEKLI